MPFGQEWTVSADLVRNTREIAIGNGYKKLYPRLPSLMFLIFILLT